MVSEFRPASRALVARPALTLAALATFTLGIGVTIAMYSVVDGGLVRPLPYPDASRLVRISEVHPGAPVTFQRHWLSNVTLEAWQPRAEALRCE